MALKQGAFFTRVCGAGGGGVVALFCEPERKETLVKKLSEQGVQLLKGEIA